MVVVVAHGAFSLFHLGISLTCRVRVTSTPHPPTLSPHKLITVSPDDTREIPTRARTFIYHKSPEKERVLLTFGGLPFWETSRPGVVHATNKWCYEVRKW